MENHIKISKTDKIVNIIRSKYSGSIHKILVVGCGFGLEAASLALGFNAKVTGIDIVENFNIEAAKYADLKQGDAMAVEFPDDFFDFIYCYHALEHISDPVKALKEMNRVLKNGGGYFIGTPNRNRIIGYIGSENTSTTQKIRWNANDWKSRVTGEFRNELGAHAGFSSKELKYLLKRSFTKVNEVSELYYYNLYAKYSVFLKTINSLGISRFLYPSVYFMGTK